MTVHDRIFGCVLVLDHLTSDGYARVGRTLGHLDAWRRARGPVPEGHQLDHACQRRNCVALHHLQSVPAVENQRRKEWAHRCRIKLCPAGHDLQANRQVTPEGGIVCRVCRDAAVKRWPQEDSRCK